MNFDKRPLYVKLQSEMTPRRPPRRWWPRAVTAAVAAAAACLALAGSAAGVRVVTPCSSYNEMHSFGNSNCNECTNIYFDQSAIDESQSDYTMARSRDGSFYPLRRRTDVQLKMKDGMVRCRWCPETQSCGHPKDRHTDCHGTDGRDQAGWVDHDQCVETDIERKKHAEDQEAYDLEMQRDMDEEKREQWNNQQQLIVRHPTDLKVRETADLHMDDSAFDCVGKCVDSGWTGCMPTLTRHRQSSAQERQEEREGIVVPADAEATHVGERVACRFNFPGDGLGPRRAVGRWKPDTGEWELCELNECTHI